MIMALFKIAENLQKHGFKISNYLNKFDMKTRLGMSFRNFAAESLLCSHASLFYSLYETSLTQHRDMNLAVYIKKSNLLLFISYVQLASFKSKDSLNYLGIQSQDIFILTTSLVF